MKLLIPLISILALVTSCGKSSQQANAETAAPTKATVNFDADSAYNYVARQVAFGPRVPGTAAHTQCHDWIASQLSSFGATVTAMDTVILNPAGKAVDIRNIYATIRPDAPRQVMLLAHYDTRPWADRDSDPNAHNTPIDGANDGASGVAVILEIARNAMNADPDTGLQILIVDAEDSGTYDGDDREWCLGSQAFAAALPHSGIRRPDYAILLDMVGGRDAQFDREYFSQIYARDVCDKIWRAAAKAGHSSRFKNTRGGAVNDDHCYLIEAGIPTVDIIESANPATGSFNPTWHTLSDNIDNIDRSTLRAVGETVTQAIFN